IKCKTRQAARVIKKIPIRKYIIMKNLQVILALLMTYVVIWLFYVVTYLLSVGFSYVLNIILHMNVNIWVVGLIIFSVYTVHIFVKNSILNVINIENDEER